MKIGVDYIGVSAGAVIINEKGEYFLAQRGPGARDDIGKWEFPGGSINLFEIRKDGVTRIISEKHGFEISVERELGVYDVIDRANGDHWISTTYVCKPKSGVPEIMVPGKCSEIGWFSFDDLQKLDLSRITTLIVRDLAATHKATAAFQP